MKTYKVAILGASGAVGTEFIQLLEERDFPVGELRLLASPRSAGRRVPFRGEELVVEAVGEDSFRGIDIAFFAAGGGVSKEWAPKAVAAGAVVIDNSSAFRLDPEVPLVVPEVNRDAIRTHKGIIANPNCSTTIMVTALAPIHRAARIRRIVVSTYQSVSGAGAKAMAELEAQVRAYAQGEPVTAQVLPVASADKHYPIAFNLIPQIDVFEELGYTKEEWKMVYETRKILDEPGLAVSPTTVRVPVWRSHSESINIETEKPLTVEEARRILSEAEGVEVIDDPQAMAYPMPITATGKDPVYVGRIRRDPSIENGLNLWVVGDQIRKGAALNALQIAEVACANGWL
ncbi:MAG TPA: aspartate-semialdehyde dehydrogenase [Limnochordia bacterium]|nr:aspartate-semialdehyde dehydrogenase [Limnochordia bacterium]